MEDREKACLRKEQDLQQQAKHLQSLSEKLNQEQEILRQRQKILEDREALVQAREEELERRMKLSAGGSAATAGLESIRRSGSLNELESARKPTSLSHLEPTARKPATFRKITPVYNEMPPPSPKVKNPDMLPPPPPKLKTAPNSASRHTPRRVASSEDLPLGSPMVMSAVKKISFTPRRVSNDDLPLGSPMVLSTPHFAMHSRMPQSESSSTSGFMSMESTPSRRPPLQSYRSPLDGKKLFRGYTEEGHASDNQASTWGEKYYLGKQDHGYKNDERGRSERAGSGGVVDDRTLDQLGEWLDRVHINSAGTTPRKL